MMRIMSRLRPCLHLALFLGLCALLAPAVPARAAGPPASIDEVITLARNGLSDETILAFVRNRSIHFTGGAEEILQLRRAGVSEAVIQALLESASGSGGYAADAQGDVAYLQDESAGMLESYVPYTSGYVYSSTYYPLTYFPRYYYGSIYVGNIVYPRFWYAHRYHGARFLGGRHRHGVRHPARPRVFGSRFVVTDDPGFAHLRRHGRGFRAGVGFSRGRGAAFGARSFRRSRSATGAFPGGVYGRTAPGATPGMGAAFPGGTPQGSANR